VENLIVREAPGDEAVPLDVVFVGAGPAGLSGAIELARLVAAGNEAGDGVGELEIGIGAVQRVAVAVVFQRSELLATVRPNARSGGAFVDVVAEMEY